MKNKKGFTLTEILLAVMILGIVGVALASLTTAASREAGIGRSRVVLRENLSLALRQLRQDVHDSTQLWYARGAVDTTVPSGAVPLLLLLTNSTFDGAQVDTGNQFYILYCFQPGTVATLDDGRSVQPTGSRDEGIIYRKKKQFSNVSSIAWADTYNPSCGTPSSDSEFEVFLEHVKFIPVTTNGYPVPLFQVHGVTGRYSHRDSAVSQKLGSELLLKLILELPTLPVLNDVTEETFVLRNGFWEFR